MKAPDLGKMVGPLPLGAWLGVVGGGLGLAYMAKKKAGAAPPVVPGPASPNGGLPVTGGGVVALPDNAPGGAGAGGSLTPLAPAPTTNDEWARYAAIVLIGHGFGAYATQQALAKYLEGQQLTAEESAIVEAAMRYIGPPPYSPPVAPPPLPARAPQPVPAVPVAVEPTPVAPVAPVAPVNVAPAPPPPPPPSVPVPAPTPVAYAVPVANPIPGDTSTVVAVTGPYPFVYGGSADQAQAILNQYAAPAPVAPPPPPPPQPDPTVWAGYTWETQTGGWDDPRYSW